MEGHNKDHLERPLLTTNTSQASLYQPSRWFEVVKKGGENELNVRLVVEDFRTAFYYSFALLLGFGYILTMTFVEVDHTAIIKSVFGASNVCTYIDFPPSTYVVPCIWMVCFILGIIYDIASIFRIWISKEEGKISGRAMCFLVAAHIYFIITLVVFSLTFAVSPDRANPETMIVHTIPYLNFKTAVCSPTSSGLVWGKCSLVRFPITKLCRSHKLVSRYSSIHGNDYL